jgi:hypothetical protein
MISIAIVLAALAIIGAAIAAFVFLGSRVRAGQGIGASFGSIMVAYFYAMCIVSLVVFTIGATSLVKVGLGEVLGRSFSYPVQLLVKPVAPIPPPGTTYVAPSPDQNLAAEQQQNAQIEQEVRSDLVQGGSLAVAGAIVWALHALGLRRLVRAADAFAAFLARAYLVVILIVFGLGGLISLVLGVYQSLLFALTSIDSFTYRQPPGEAAAMAIVYVPAWAIVLGLALRELRRERQ